MFLVFVFANPIGINAQGTFQDLDFEEANIVPIVGSPLYPYVVTVADALPGWAVNYGTAQQTQILYNDEALGSTAVTLYASGYPGFYTLPLQGNYSVLLQEGTYVGAPSASITQTGLVPAGSESLLFDATSDPEPPEVLIGNQSVSLVTVGSGANYTIFGADISSWAGQTEQLTITTPGVSGNWEIDNISFSPNTIPEPGTLALVLMGGLAFGVRSWRKRGKAFHQNKKA